MISRARGVPNILFPAETELSDSDSNRARHDDDLNHEHCEKSSVASPFLRS